MWRKTTWKNASQNQQISLIRKRVQDEGIMGFIHEKKWNIKQSKFVIFLAGGISNENASKDNFKANIIATIQ